MKVVEGNFNKEDDKPTPEKIFESVHKTIGDNNYPILVVCLMPNGLLVEGNTSLSEANVVLDMTKVSLLEEAVMSIVQQNNKDK